MTKVIRSKPADIFVCAYCVRFEERNFGNVQLDLPPHRKNAHKSRTLIQHEPPPLQSTSIPINTQSGTDIYITRNLCDALIPLKTSNSRRISIFGRRFRPLAARVPIKMPRNAEGARVAKSNFLRFRCQKSPEVPENRERPCDLTPQRLHWDLPAFQEVTLTAKE